jgi:hypothetical protein
LTELLKDLKAKVVVEEVVEEAAEVVVEDLKVHQQHCHFSRMP